MFSCHPLFRPLIALFVLLVCGSASATNTVLHGGSFYEYVPTDTTWTVAKAAAESMSHFGFPGRLATITSAEEDAAVKSIVNSGALVMLGASDAAQEGTWVWETGPEAGTVFWTQGAPVAGQYTGWRPGEPNAFFADEDYLALYRGSWVDSSADRFLHGGYVVEYRLGREGFDFGMTNGQLGSIRNLAPEARLVSLDLELAADTFIDSAPGAPGTEFAAWSTIDSSPGASWTRPDGVETDGKQKITLAVDLAPLEELHFQVDLDRLSAPDGEGIAIGTIVTAHFLMGDLNYAVTATVGAKPISILGTEFPFSARGMNTAPVPVPPSLLLLGTGLFPLVWRSRRARLRALDFLSA